MAIIWQMLIFWKRIRFSPSRNVCGVWPLRERVHQVVIEVINSGGAGELYRNPLFHQIECWLCSEWLLCRFKGNRCYLSCQTGLWWLSSIGQHKLDTLTGIMFYSIQLHFTENKQFLETISSDSKRFIKLWKIHSRHAGNKDEYTFLTELRMEWCMVISA